MSRLNEQKVHLKIKLVSYIAHTIGKSLQEEPECLCNFIWDFFKDETATISELKRVIRIIFET